ncbi:hypothetical protein HOD20_02210 [archaeon]|jgi:hypothetical protein|nr:hypothetical protein [archaeon]MBT4647016.1 hypothetical protein [archaeon]MBT6822462.1 hypothetical protein [archaeon]MBT7391991.1 hypothetical protein [archaeon]
MQKRGITQLDWALSLAIFILFIAWFFIFIQPNLTHGLNKDVLASIIETKFVNNFTWTLKKMPIFIYTEDITQNKPIILNFTESFTDFKFLDNQDFVSDNNELLLVADITTSPKTLWLVSGGNYSVEHQIKDLIVSSNWVTTSKNMSINFDDSIFDILSYDSQQRFNDAEIYINDIIYEPENVTFNDSRLVGIYRADSQSINHSTFVYSENTFIEVLVKQNDPSTNISYKGSIELNNYSNYYTSNLKFGEFNSTTELININYTGDYITFYGDDALSFDFGKNTTININHYNKTISFDYEFLFLNDSRYSIEFHQGNYENYSRNDYSVRYGIIEEIEGLSLDLLENIDYETYKTLWKYPKERNFVVTITNSTLANRYNETKPIFNFGPNITSNAAVVYSKDLSSYYLTSDFELVPIVINIRVW